MKISVILCLILKLFLKLDKLGVRYRTKVEIFVFTKSYNFLSQEQIHK
jgi:hypothetical protein